MPDLSNLNSHINVIRQITEILREPFRKCRFRDIIKFNSDFTA